jgi:16S rRNA (cytidine1402-2'-O)-methyltransferase
VSIEAGILYVVATPLGNLADFTYRAVQTLQKVDVIAAEDTRHSRPLLNHYGIGTPMLSLHEHNERARTKKLIARLCGGESIALISDAGTPLISDPGYRLVIGARRAGIQVSPVPGPSALIAALSASGLATDRFVFEGFLPARSAAREQRLRELKLETRTLVFYESSHRVTEALAAMRHTLGARRQAVVARELTKAFETLHGDSLDALCCWIQADVNQRRGEFVICVEGAQNATNRDVPLDAVHLLSVLLTELPVKTAARLTAELTGEKRNRLYQLALRLTDELARDFEINRAPTERDH